MFVGGGGCFCGISVQCCLRAPLLARSAGDQRSLKKWKSTCKTWTRGKVCVTAGERVETWKVCANTWKRGKSMQNGESMCIPIPKAKGLGPLDKTVYLAYFWRSGFATAVELNKDKLTPVPYAQPTLAANLR